MGQGERARHLPEAAGREAALRVGIAVETCGARREGGMQAQCGVGGLNGRMTGEGRLSVKERAVGAAA